MSDPHETAASLLGSAEYCTLATYGVAGLTCATMFYAPTGSGLLAILSNADSRHVANIEKTGECTLVVAPLPIRFGQPALQVRASCEAEVTTDADARSEVESALFDRFPSAKPFFAELERRGHEIAALRLEVKSVDLLDERHQGPAHNVRLDKLSREVLSTRAI